MRKIAIHRGGGHPVIRLPDRGVVVTLSCVPATPVEVAPVEIVGEPGIGKSRLLGENAVLAYHAAMRHVACGVALARRTGQNHVATRLVAAPASRCWFGR